MTTTQNVVLRNFGLFHYAKMYHSDEAAKTILKAVKKRIVELRKTKGLTQEKVAELLDVESRTIQRWEGLNEKEVTLWALCRLSIIFGCSILDFFEKEENQKQR